ncbi:shugoshin 1 isoform X2 [Austrofundulus limnaeus]|uniref:Shugoshin 1 isoform X2 n=1 Tax=Austrofundulus limnaeus TaxID=52670 RepID=A0A2I4B0J2_AUSLI|nr:PREDICTED: shugoshin-like 1 isoform X2 [Austrofundulus limnaeus]
MDRERPQKKSFQQTLEDIKERMKEKRVKRVASAANPSMKRSRMINKNSGPSSTHTILKGVQQNNQLLAVALQAEKEKVRQAHAVILQLKGEQQALFLHLLLLKRKLKEQEALAASTSEAKPADILVETQKHLDSARRSSQKLHEHILSEASQSCADPSPPKTNEEFCGIEITLPSTVGVRRRNTDRRSRRRSEWLRQPALLSEGDPVAGLGAIIPSPIHSDSKDLTENQQGAEAADLSDTEEIHHSTPEPAPTKKSKQPNRKQTQQQPRSKTEPASQKPERGRKPERAPLKKPWENPKPRARSKTRERAATRAKTAPPAQSNKLNTSLGMNDTFDFDCEEAVHITPFKAKTEDCPPATPKNEEAQIKAAPAVSEQSDTSSSPSSESEDSLYVPQKSRWRQISPDGTKGITTRKRWSSNVVKRKEKKSEEFSGEESVFKVAKPEKCETKLHHLPDSALANVSERLEQENSHEPHREKMEECLLPVSPLVDAEMMRISNVLSNFRKDSCEASSLVPHQTPWRLKTVQKRVGGVKTEGRGLGLCDVTNMQPTPFRNFSGGSRPSDVRCSTPVPVRKRRCTMTVDYKEPSLNAKLRRGDKFTDTQFLNSPVFKQKSGRKSVQKNKVSVSSRQSLEKYNESFVGCR